MKLNLKEVQKYLCMNDEDFQLICQMKLTNRCTLDMIIKKCDSVEEAEFWIVKIGSILLQANNHGRLWTV